MLKLGIGEELETFLKANLDMFAWDHKDMVGIDSKIIHHRLNIDLEKNQSDKSEELSMQKGTWP